MNKAYIIANVRLTSYPEKSVIAVAEFAAKMGVQVKIDGLPFGAPYSGAPGEDDIAPAVEQVKKGVG